MGGICSPLAAAVIHKRLDVLVWLLSRGADPNREDVVMTAAIYSTADILQLLIDAGSDVNWEWDGAPLLMYILTSRSALMSLRVLLAQPSLTLTSKLNRGKTPEQYPRDIGRPDLADMIAQEVSGALLAG